MKTKILKPVALALLSTLSACSSTQSGLDLSVSQAPTKAGAMAQPSFHTKGTTGKIGMKEHPDISKRKTDVPRLRIFLFFRR